jgi:hypothetical protein
MLRNALNRRSSRPTAAPERFVAREYWSNSYALRKSTVLWLRHEKLALFSTQFNIEESCHGPFRH